MSIRSRRHRATCVIAVDAVCAVTLAGVASAQPPDPITGESLRIGLGSQPHASQLPLVYGVDRNGGDFGLALDTTLRAMKELKSDFTVLRAAVAEYIDAPPSDESLRELFDLIQKYPFWTDDGGLSDDSVRFMIDIANESGVLSQPMNAADVVDRETLSRAVELANMPTR